MDIEDTIAPKSDQLDAVDLIGGARTFTVERVVISGGEQPVDIHLAEFPRPWRPGLSMRRVLFAIWGKSSTYPGRRLTLFCDPRVKFGGAAVGGVRISHMSDLDKPRGVPLLVSRGKSEVYTVKPLVEPLPDAPAEPTAEQVAACTDLNELYEWYRRSSPERQEQIKARAAELKAAE